MTSDPSRGGLRRLRPPLGARHLAALRGLGARASRRTQRSSAVLRRAPAGEAAAEPRLRLRAMGGLPLVTYPEMRPWLLDNWERVIATGASRARPDERGESLRHDGCRRSRGSTARRAARGRSGRRALPLPGSLQRRLRHAGAAPGASTRPAARATSSSRARSTTRRSLRLRMPEVVWRRGIDLNPIDAADADAVDWLANARSGPVPITTTGSRGCAPPLRSRPPIRPRSCAATSSSDLTDVAATAARATATLVVFHSAVLLYLDAGQRRRFADLDRGLGERSAAAWSGSRTRRWAPCPRSTRRFPRDRHRSPLRPDLDRRRVALAGQHGAVYETRPFRD